MKKCVLMFSVLLLTIILASIEENKNTIQKNESVFINSISSDSLLASTKH